MCFTIQHLMYLPHIKWLVVCVAQVAKNPLIYLMADKFAICKLGVRGEGGTNYISRGASKIMRGGALKYLYLWYKDEIL